ncbi:ABC transporter permease [Planktomarina temperata]|nr:ABC transporter permease [Planktomarina temperata]MDB2519710.1 ABC transporter permease [Planktomarina temperata]
MGTFIIRRTALMLLTALSLTFIVFVMTNLQPNLEKLAKTQGNFRMSEAEVSSYLRDRGFDRPVTLKYGEWLGIVPSYLIEGRDGETRSRCSAHGVIKSNTPRYCGIIQGYWGQSWVFKEPVADVIAKRLSATGVLMFWVFLVMVPSALFLGVLAGMKEGSRLDRTLSTGAIATTATPEYVSGVVFIALLASSKFGLSPLFNSLGWSDKRILFKGSATSAAKEMPADYDVYWLPDFLEGFWWKVAEAPTLENFMLPVLTIALYGMGYIARMTRASMAEVMTSQYIRTARLKGVNFRNIVIKHALRNALIAPFTVIMLQIPWLLTGVVIVETLFNFKGLGFALVQAAGNNDIDLLLAVSVVSVIVVLMTQLISDIGYIFLNPRISMS